MKKGSEASANRSTQSSIPLLVSKNYVFSFSDVPRLKKAPMRAQIDRPEFDPFACIRGTTFFHCPNSQDWKKALRRAQIDRPEIDFLAFSLKKFCFRICGDPKIEKMPCGDRKSMDQRSIPLLFLQFVLGGILEVPELK